MSEGLLLPGAPRTALTQLYAATATSRLLSLEAVIAKMLLSFAFTLISPITVVPCRAKTKSFNTRRSYFTPKF